MEIIYTPNLPWGGEPPVIEGELNYLSLSGNNWDDFGYKTTLNARLFFDGDAVDIRFSIKLLIENIGYTAKYLDGLCNKGWDGVFPIPECNYISLPTDIDFYKAVKSRLNVKEGVDFLLLLRDAGILKEDAEAIQLMEGSAFSTSLLREGGSNKCFQDGWRIFKELDDSIRDFKFNLETKSGFIRELDFCFESNILPYDINVLIGPNGVGKSYCLRSLVEHWLQVGMGDPEKNKNLGYDAFDYRPNINRLILVSYSPFEEFSLGLKRKDKVIDKQAYRYFGFRYQAKNGRIAIRRGLPKQNASESLIDAIYEDYKYKGETWWVNKYNICLSVLRKALEFDFIYVRLKPDFNEEYSEVGDLIEKNESGIYLRLDSSLPEIIEKEDLLDFCDLQEGVGFVNDLEFCELSSGQRLFSYIVINVVGSIRDKSLVIIDEPELFLHPNLEIEFISLLKAVLKPFESKAILATHSLSVVREVPSKCVHIFREDEDGLDIVRPPFETFGGSVQRISSYVFGDRSVSKPFDEWIEEMVNESIDPQELIDQLGDEINEELIMKIFRMGRKN